jgi:hypothetical protein
MGSVYNEKFLSLIMEALGIFKAALRSREAFLMSKALLVVVSGGVWWWCLVVSGGVLALFKPCDWSEAIITILDERLHAQYK